MQENLPIKDLIPEIRKTLSEKNTLILQAPPGAGKSTVLPLELMNENWLQGKKIIMLEPRRLAARSVARRMASLLGEETGETIGYRIRFDTKVGKNTKVEVVTEGILTRLLQRDNSLEEYGMVILDEFHERSLHADLALALVRESQQVLREDLRILIMSATLEGDKISRLLDNAPILSSEGRQYPIQVNYVPPDAALSLSVQLSKVVRKAIQEEEGDILVFLPGAGEINKTKDLLDAESSNIKILPLYGDLSQEKQNEAILPDSYGIRKVVLATSIAETSLTIEGIKVVVDSGFSRVPKFDPRSGLTRLETVKVSKDSADQRAGRAGRLGPGVCYRLWAEGTHQYLAAHRVPEIMEADLAPLMLDLYHWGIKDITSLVWLTSPPMGAVSQAKDILEMLGAVRDDRITEHGKNLAKISAHPRIAQMIWKGKENNLLAVALDVAAILEEKDFLSREGASLDLRLEILRSWRRKEKVSVDKYALDRIERVISSWRKIFQCKEGSEKISGKEVGKLIAAAYPERIAKKTEQGFYRLSNGRTARLREHDHLMMEEWLAVAHLDAGTGEGKIFLAAALDPSDVLHQAEEKDVLKWDSQKGILIAKREKRIGTILIQSAPSDSFSIEEKNKVLLEVVKAEGVKLLPWNEDVASWQARVNSLRLWRSDEVWPDVSTSYLLSNPEEWILSYLDTIRKREDFQKLDLKNILSGTLPWPLPKKLDELAPEKMNVPSGSAIPLRYSSDGSIPILAVRLQEVFGLLETPVINEGRTKVLLHLLSPGYKPVQVTQDLKSFWKNTYPEVRKELRVRYQKHHWPEDPWTAEAVRGVKRKNNK